jgi:circadian clock protein KaiC
MKPTAIIKLESTGDAALDTILGGGLPAHSIVMIAGEPGSGKTVLTHQLLFDAAREGKKCLYLTTLAEPAMKALRYMQHFDFFDEKLVGSQIVLGDLGGPLRRGVDEALRELENKVADTEPAFVAIDSFKVFSELLRAEPAGRSRIYDLAVQLAGWGATALLIGEYSRHHLEAAEFGIADGILYLSSERQELTAVRELEVLKMRGAAHRTGTHFFEIDRSGMRFYPRVSAPANMQEQASSKTSDRVPFGIAGLDELVSGGVPRGSTTLVQGGSGVGKTLLALQYLVEGTRRGERGVMFTLEETPSQLREVARGLGWDLEKLEREDKLVLKYQSPVELSTDRFLFEARQQVQELGATLAVFDSLTTLALGVPSERRFKEMVYAISKHLRGAGITTLLTIETAQLLGAAQLTGEGVSFIADNVVQLRYIEMEGRLERAISVLKARGVKHNSELRALTISSGGLQVVGNKFIDMRGVLTGIPMRDPKGTR